MKGIYVIYGGISIRASKCCLEDMIWFKHLIQMWITQSVMAGEFITSDWDSIDALIYA